MKRDQQIDQYFEQIMQEVDKVIVQAQHARKKGYDPEAKVEIPLARDMAERVEGLISAAAPQIIGSGISKRIKELEQEYGALDWRISLVIAEEIAHEKFCTFKDKKEAMEVGIRVGFAYHTLGTVASPLEGFVEIKIRQRADGKEYFALQYSGPIRSAGGTGASVSVLIADYVRKKMGYASYDPTEQEVKRMITELYDYHERVTNLQYLPSEQEIEFLVKHLPVQIDGDPSEKIEVSNYKDLPRIETNTVRNGPCLVIGECLAQKAPKLWKQLGKWGKDFSLDHWGFLEAFIALQKNIKAHLQTKSTSKTSVSADYTYIKDLVAGRPVLAHPLHVGGFRLRYGRSRVSGYSSVSIHPATMHILNEYIGTGTQLKVERPGKACALTVCDTIEGPIVKLDDGSVVLLQDEISAKKSAKKVSQILFLGDFLVNYGDFLNRAHPLIPCGYCEEWYAQELERATVNLFGSLDTQKLASYTELDAELLSTFMRHPTTTFMDGGTALILTKKLQIPLHPRYTYHWRLISKQQLLLLIEWLAKASYEGDVQNIQKIILPLTQNHEQAKSVLESIGFPHQVINNEFVIIDKDHGTVLANLFALGDTEQQAKIKAQVSTSMTTSTPEDLLMLIGEFSRLPQRDKSGTFIGARMGRPEKAKLRKLTGSPHILFPVGEQGGKLRSFQAALELGHITADFPLYYCAACKSSTILSVCERCDLPTQRKYHCKTCGLLDKPECERHGKCATWTTQKLEIGKYFDALLKKLDTKTYPDLIKGVRGTSNKDHIPEHLLKGILRAKHDVYVNKDGTCRFDMTQLPITHFKPIEIGTSVQRLQEMGYTHDIYDAPLTNNQQILELFPQDIILPMSVGSQDAGAQIVFFHIAAFVDELLEKLYGLPPYYCLGNYKDLAGHLVLTLAPHTSAGIINRIIGFSDTQGLFAHPMVHAATRRDTDGDEACSMLLLDVLLNFSRHYLPAHRGSTQDAPLVMTSRLVPSEVDDMVFDVDVVWRYPLEFYEACMRYEPAWNIKIERLVDRLHTPAQYYNWGFTHHTTNINAGITCSAYKTLPSMEEKLKGQMELAEKIRAVEEQDVARLVIEKHFLKDIKGNLRKFSQQQFRCVNCNEKYRRPPLLGQCIRCKGKLIFTISEGSVTKYLEPSLSLAKKYHVSAYLQQSLELVKMHIESVFGKEKERQEGLGKWFG
ncbi:DNA polymerase II large subunit [Candidatus Woesearchaeota archaeon]|nr:DNA polymerase II large subunit [Candidatus Woesearchaeota archaeon]